MRFEFDLACKRAGEPDPEIPAAAAGGEAQATAGAPHWQYLVVTLLLLVMGILVVHQRGRTRKMQRLAMTDELTGIHNRRQIQAKGRKWFTQARRRASH